MADLKLISSETYMIDADEKEKLEYLKQFDVSNDIPVDIKDIRANSNIVLKHYDSIENKNLDIERWKVKWNDLIN